MDIRIVHQPSTGQNVLFFQDLNFDEMGIESGRKTGFLSIKPGVDPNKALELAKTRSWVFGQYNRQNGLYIVAAVGATEAVEANGETLMEKV